MSPGIYFGGNGTVNESQDFLKDSDGVCIRKAPANELAVSHRSTETSILLQDFEKCKTNLYVDLCANAFYSGFLHSC